MSLLERDNLQISTPAVNKIVILDPFSLSFINTIQTPDSQNSWSVTTWPNGSAFQIRNTKTDYTTSSINLFPAVHISDASALGVRFGLNGLTNPMATLEIPARDPTIPGFKVQMQYASGNNVDIAAIEGINIVDSNWGIGVMGFGGFIGVKGIIDGAYSPGGIAILGDVTNQQTGQYAGYFNGDVLVTGNFTNPSDHKLKTNIVSINQKKADNKIISKINLLKPKSYTYDKKFATIMNLPKGKQNGFIAQDLKKIFPELVVENIYKSPNDKNEEIEFLSIKYIGLIPILTASIQELSEDNVRLENQLERENKAMRQRISQLESQIQKLLSK